MAACPPLAEAADAARYGGKAAGLARLIGAGLPVPEGFCVPADADAEAIRAALGALGEGPAAGNTTSTFTTPTYLFANRVDTRYSKILQVDNGGNSWYNGLAVQLNKRLSHGITAKHAGSRRSRWPSSCSG